MTFGFLAKAKLPTSYGEFYISVLPEKIGLGTQNKQPIAAYLEHYAMVPRCFDPARPGPVYVRYRDVVVDLFSQGSGQEPGLQRRILGNLANENGILICIDSLSPFAHAALSRRRVPGRIETAGQNRIVDIFKETLGIGYAPIIQTSTYNSTKHPHRMEIETDVGKFLVRRHDTVNRVFFPDKALPFLFPQDADNPPLYIKHFDHYLLRREGTSLDTPLTRVHSSCETGDINGSHRCDCGDQFYQTMEKIGKETGMIIYLRQEGRQMDSLALKIQHYARMKLLGHDWDDGQNLEDAAYHTYSVMNDFGYPDDNREYHAVSYILEKEGIDKIVLLTNNKDKLAGIIAANVNVAGQELVPMPEHIHPAKEHYMRTKIDVHGHGLRL